MNQIGNDIINNKDPISGNPILPPSSKNKNKNKGRSAWLGTNIYTSDEFATEEEVSSYKKTKVPGGKNKNNIGGNTGGNIGGNTGGNTGGNQGGAVQGGTVQGSIGPGGGGIGATGATRPDGPNIPGDGGENRDPYTYRGIRVWWSENKDGTGKEKYILAGASEVLGGANDSGSEIPGYNPNTTQGIVRVGQTKNLHC